MKMRVGGGGGGGGEHLLDAGDFRGMCSTT